MNRTSTHAKASRWGVVAALVIAVGLTALPRESDACSCIYATLQTQYQSAHEVLRIRVTKEIKEEMSGDIIFFGGPVYYRARVLKDYKNCHKRGDWIKISTSSGGASCGVTLTPGQTYVIVGYDSGDGKIGISSCGYVRQAKSVTAEELEFLNTREVCCGGVCKCTDGSFPAPCFVDPCSVVEPCFGAECVANFCADCGAEFYSADGMALCLPCEGDWECGFFGACFEGQCIGAGIP